MPQALATVTGCLFALENGAKCNHPQTVARGYCQKHYSLLRRANAFAEVLPKVRTSERNLTHNVAAVRKARRKLLKAAPTFVDHLIAGSEIAAATGDTKAAQWAILHTETIAPINVNPNINVNPQQTNINIGVRVSGTPSADTAIATNSDK